MRIPTFPALGRFLWGHARGGADYELPHTLNRMALQAFADREGPRGAETMAEIADKGEGNVREIALALLETHPGPAAAPLLMRLMRRGVGDFPWQRRVAGVLARCPRGSARKELESLAEAASGRLKPLSAWILMRRGDAGYADVLAGVAGDPQASVEARRFSALALAATGDPARAALLRGLAASPDARLRTAGAVGLALVGDPEGRAAVVRELEWTVQGSDDRPGLAFEAAAAVGGEGVVRALMEIMARGDRFGDEALASLAEVGGPGPGSWRRVLDTFPFGETGPGGRLGPLLDRLADGGNEAECREALACLREDFVPGAMRGVDLARAARLARRAGEASLAERYYRRAHRDLLGSDGGTEAEAFVRLACDFGREADRALVLARRLTRRGGSGTSSADLLARALAAAGKREEALDRLDEALGDIAAPGRPRLVRLRARLAGE
jgi:hypothetical protein